MKRSFKAFAFLAAFCIGLQAAPLFASAQEDGIVSVEDGTVFDAATRSEFGGMENYRAEDVEGYIDKVQTYYTGCSDFSTGWDWLTATYYLGDIEAYRATGNEKYYEQAYDIAEEYGWLVNGGTDSTYLDAVATSLVYCMLYDLAPNDYKIADVRRALDYICSYGMDDYSWVDEFYMAGLAHSYLSKVTGDKKYSEVDFASYRYYRERFFDEEQWLWFRDWTFVPETGSNWANLDNAEKVLWSRGNTWVYVTLTQRMLYMDQSDPAYPFYKNDFVMMSKGLMDARREDGIWNVNLGDDTHKAGKEMTGTGGFLYGLCTGIELGILEPEIYVPVVQKAYDTITGVCIRADGRVGYCQPPAGSPSSYTTEEELKDNTVSYGVGLTLMGLSRFMRLCKDYKAPVLDPPNEDMDVSANRFGVLDGDWYRGVMFPSTDATEYTAMPNNGVENAVNGSWQSKEEGESFRGGGLNRGGGVTLTVDFAEPPVLDRIVMILHASYSYRYKIEIYDGSAWHTVRDTTEKEAPKVYLDEISFSPLRCERVKLTAGNYWNTSTYQYLWIREMLFYEAKEGV